MVKKTVWTLSCVCFSMSTLLSLVGIISIIQIYFNVSIYLASLYASIFAGALGVSSVITPAFFSRFEKKKLILAVLLITALCNLVEFFVTNYYIALVFRIIPAILYPIAVSTALTIVGKIDPNSTNKVVLGVSAGSILGLSITSYLGLTYGYQAAMLWFALINFLSLILTFLFIPNFEGNKEPVIVQIGHAKSKLFLFSILYVLFVIIGISITYNYIPTYLSQVTQINGEALFITLLLMGLTSLVGTTLSGYLIQKNGNLTVFFYPVGFAVIMFILGIFVRIPVFEFISLMIFSIFDGSAYTIAQYWVTSSVRESPEFANGIFLLMSNLSIFIGTMIGGMIIDMVDIVYIFIGSVIMMIAAIPFVLIRIKKYPNVY
ncbi:MFS transporter [uncultured Methanobrevibacter sp.]|uniref:MFS transporter n=1 Tax=uncultured Methanobrevibacter sp. TaxID=253161 RepID=UPI0025E777E3|nr:MFS transporter [uncultured Methanobrevibacter sp.]